jgi:hypothetical protein
MSHAAEGIGAIGLPLRLTAVLLLLRPQGPPLIQAAQLGLGTLALVSTPALQRSALWYSAALAVAVRIAWDWPLADNHVYLLAYWCLAIGLALGGAAPPATLARGARWLLASAMALAVLWKAALSPDYVDGRFFRMTLLVDERFEDVVRIAAGMDAAEIDRHRQALRPVAQGAELAADDTIVEPESFRRLSLVLTWGGLLWESALAAAFVAPLPLRRRWLRHALLLGFCGAVYPVAPVAGFGWLLLAIGLSQVPGEARAWRSAYVAVWLLVLAATELPWAWWVAEALG